MLFPTHTPESDERDHGARWTNKEPPKHEVWYMGGLHTDVDLTSKGQAQSKLSHHEHLLSFTYTQIENDQVHKNPKQN